MDVWYGSDRVERGYCLNQVTHRYSSPPLSALGPWGRLAICFTWIQRTGTDPVEAKETSPQCPASLSTNTQTDTCSWPGVFFPWTVTFGAYIDWFTAFVMYTVFHTLLGQVCEPLCTYSHFLQHPFKAYMYCFVFSSFFSFMLSILSNHLIMHLIVMVNVQTLFYVVLVCYSQE